MPRLKVQGRKPGEPLVRITIVNWRADVCKYGHPMADAYPQRRKGRVVGRICRTCTKAKNAERYRKRRKYIEEPVVRPEARA